MDASVATRESQLIPYQQGLNCGEALCSILMGVDYFSLHTLVMVCDRKTIACYRERTAITSLNKQRQSLHKKAVI
ncbi:hypothetical protein QUA30_26475 [Microcoleus sp. Pol14C2]|uniref:hypothetical protein n=1 Tax=unclassified Microcoleus TaxID=2642155 RepID=UPI002FD649A0